MHRKIMLFLHTLTMRGSTGNTVSLAEFHPVVKEESMMDRQTDGCMEK